LAVAVYCHARYDRCVARARKIAIKKRTVRARVRGNSLDLLEWMPFRDGEEVLVSVSEAAEPQDLEALRRAAGAWKGLVDTDALIVDIYSDRLIATRPSPQI
jgi:hypothetical protein